MQFLSLKDHVVNATVWKLSIFYRKATKLIKQHYIVFLFFYVPNFISNIILMSVIWFIVLEIKAWEMSLKKVANILWCWKRRWFNSTIFRLFSGLAQKWRAKKAHSPADKVPRIIEWLHCSCSIYCTLCVFFSCKILVGFACDHSKAFWDGQNSLYPYVVFVPWYHGIWKVYSLSPLSLSMAVCLIS